MRIDPKPSTGARCLGAARLGLVLVASLAPACGPAAAGPARPPEAAAPRSSGAASAPAPSAEAKKADPAGPQLTITITPDPKRAAADIKIVARGDAAALGTWSIAAPDADAVRLTEVRDDTGPLATSLTARAPKALVIALPRPPVGDVHVRYSVESRAHPAVTVEVDPDRLQAAGEALLLLPDGFDDRSVATSIRLVTEPLGENAAAASSFGAGKVRDVTARGSELRFGTFLIGPVGRALFDAVEGHDEAAWLGYTSFDPRPIAADVAAFRTAVREIFRDRSRTPLTLLIVADARPPGAFVASRRASSVLVHVGVGEPWSGPVRIAVAAEVIHGFIGERLWIGPDEPSREAEAYWFTEGVTRHLARELLFRFGLITPTEVLAELHGLAGVLATSARAGEPNAALAARAKEPGALPVLVARGALYATRMDARIRKKTGDKRGLEDVLRALYAKASERRAALPTSAWIEAVAAELGAGEAEAFAAMIEKGGPIDIPEGALGPCFRGTTRRYEAFDLGFDEEATRASPARAVAGVRPGGPAARAGLEVGDVLANAEIKRGRSDVPVILTIERGGEQKIIRYKPVGKAASGQGWIRQKDVADEACVK
jgi:predicted metalloprotease with PDZ domain